MEISASCYKEKKKIGTSRLFGYILSVPPSFDYEKILFKMESVSSFF